MHEIEIQLKLTLFLRSGTIQSQTALNWETQYKSEHHAKRSCSFNGRTVLYKSSFSNDKMSVATHAQFAAQKIR